MENYSILMSVYYKEKAEFLDKSIESMLLQTVKSNDFVLVCDGPLNEELDNVIQKYQREYPEIFNIIRLEKNQGLGNALNTGLKHCKNELVARMDSDDVCIPERCEIQLKKLAECPELDIISGSIQEFHEQIGDASEKRILPEKHEQIYEYAKTRCPFNHMTVMFKKTAVEKAGYYQEVPLYEDYDLWFRMLLQGSKGYNIQQILCFVRMDRSSYERRGGISYLQKIADFRVKMYKAHFCSLSQFLFGIGGQAAVCILPSSVRAFIYKKFLRK